MNDLPAQKKRTCGHAFLCTAICDVCARFHDGRARRRRLLEQRFRRADHAYIRAAMEKEARHSLSADDPRRIDAQIALSTAGREFVRAGRELREFLGGEPA